MYTIRVPRERFNSYGVTADTPGSFPHTLLKGRVAFDLGDPVRAPVRSERVEDWGSELNGWRTTRKRIPEMRQERQRPRLAKFNDGPQSVYGPTYRLGIRTSKWVLSFPIHIKQHRVLAKGRGPFEHTNHTWIHHSSGGRVSERRVPRKDRRARLWGLRLSGVGGHHFTRVGPSFKNTHPSQSLEGTVGCVDSLP